MNDASGENIEELAVEEGKSQVPVSKKIFSNDDAHLSPR